MKIALKKVIGVFFVLLGLLIFITPFTPGSIILLIGLDMLIGDKWPWWQRQKAKFRRIFTSV